MKPDEAELLAKIRQRGAVMGPETPGAWQIAESLGMPYKRAQYILRDKWGDKKGWYEYGVSWRYGWLTPEGWAETENLV